MDDIDDIHIDTTGVDFGDDGYQNMGDENIDPNRPVRRKSARKAMQGNYYKSSNKNNKNNEREEKKEDDAPFTPPRSIRLSRRSRRDNNTQNRPVVTTPGTNEFFIEDLSSGNGNQNRLIEEWIRALKEYLASDIIQFDWFIDKLLDQPDRGDSFHGVYDSAEIMYKVQSWRPKKLNKIVSPPIQLLAEAFHKKSHPLYCMSDFQMCFLKKDIFEILKNESEELYQLFTKYCWHNYAAIGTNPFFGTQTVNNVKELRVKYFLN